jgi:hypothetical protein
LKNLLNYYMKSLNKLIQIDQYNIYCIYKINNRYLVKILFIIIKYLNMSIKIYNFIFNNLIIISD